MKKRTQRCVLGRKEREAIVCYKSKTVSEKVKTLMKHESF